MNIQGLGLNWSLWFLYFLDEFVHMIKGSQGKKEKNSN